MPSLTDFPIGEAVELLHVFRRYPELTTPEMVAFIGRLYEWESAGLLKLWRHPILFCSLRVKRLR